MLYGLRNAREECRPDRALSTGYCMALQNGVIAFLLQDPFYPVQISHFTTTKAPPDHHIASTMLDRWRQALFQHLFNVSASHECSSLWSEHLKLQICLSITLLSNLPLSSVCVLLPLLIFFFIGQSEIWLFFSIPESPLHCWHWDCCFPGTILQIQHAN